jgi:hypothetical protein
MEDIHIETIEWQAPEYTHKEKSPDFLWTIGLVAVVAAIVAFFLGNYVFGIFILISGACLIMFTSRPPQMMTFSIKTEGLSIGKNIHAWKSLKGFDMKAGDPYAKLLVETSKNFLPIYTIPMPVSRKEEIRETLKKVIPATSIEESRSMVFMEKLGF